jgi:hypothetical protein
LHKLLNPVVSPRRELVRQEVLLASGFDVE